MRNMYNCVQYVQYVQHVQTNALRDACIDGQISTRSSQSRHFRWVCPLRRVLGKIWLCISSLVVRYFYFYLTVSNVPFDLGWFERKTPQTVSRECRMQLLCTRRSQ